MFNIVNQVLLLSSPSSTLKSFYPVKSCSDKPDEMLQNCTQADETIHCLSDEHNNTGIGCFTVAWINKGDRITNAYNFLSLTHGK